jgi:hypothetical protein
MWRAPAGNRVSGRDSDTVKGRCGPRCTSASDDDSFGTFTPRAARLSRSVSDDGTDSFNQKKERSERRPSRMGRSRSDETVVVGAHRASSKAPRTRMDEIKSFAKRASQMTTRISEDFSRNGRKSGTNVSGAPADGASRKREDAPKCAQAV